LLAKIQTIQAKARSRQASERDVADLEQIRKRMEVVTAERDRTTTAIRWASLLTRALFDRHVSRDPEKLVFVLFHDAKCADPKELPHFVAITYYPEQTGGSPLIWFPRASADLLIAPNTLAHELVHAAGYRHPTVTDKSGVVQLQRDGASNDLMNPKSSALSPSKIAIRPELVILLKKASFAEG
jgi:hypothetical protein